MAASLALAISAIRAGRKEEGRQLLNLLIQQNPNNEQAWLWMSSVVNTDEQRARCLYHVLAINPDNDLARRGLKVLGIVVTDSRPVKIPRDSQPIKIPKPTPVSQSGFPTSDQLDSRPVQPTERRPFRIDPETIVSELPFTPVKDPFTGTPQAEQPTGQRPSKLVLADSADAQEAPAQPEEKTAGQTKSASKPVPTAQAQANAQDARPQPPSAPVPPVAQSRGNEGPAAQPEQQADPQQTPAPQPGSPDSQSTVPGAGTVNDTRPSQPFPVHSQPTQGVSQHVPPYQQQQPGVHSNVTMGMPTHYVNTQQPSQPMPPQGWGPHPSEPVPSVHSSGTIQMPAYWQPQFQPAMPQNPSIHSSATMAMPMGYDPFAAMNAAVNQGYRDPKPAKPGSKRTKQNEEEDSDDEVNIVAVIIFGSLSITALGGLGMLILLMFTAG